MLQKADPDHMLSHGTTYVRIRGGQFRGVAPVGGVDVKRTEASPDRSAEATPTSLSEGRGQDERPEKARRTARSSSGHTARGRGFMK